MEKLLAILFTTGLMVSSMLVYADEDITDKMQQAREFHEKEQARADHEAMRDKSHDGRISIDKDTSFGGTGDKDHKTGEVRGEVNVKKTF